jgi:phosphoribosylglycinamide formyltransferase-1
VDARVAAVVSNKAEAKGLVFAREHGIATEVLDHKQFDSREAFDAALAQASTAMRRRWWCWPASCAFSRRALCALCRAADQHPPFAAAGLSGPAHAPARHRCGLQVCGLHRAPGDGRAGRGAHPGPGRGARAAGDTAETLAARVLTQEHIIYPRAVAHFLRHL